MTFRFEVQNVNHSATTTTHKKTKSIGSIDALEGPGPSPFDRPDPNINPLLLKTRTIIKTPSF